MSFLVAASGRCGRTPEDGVLSFLWRRKSSLLLSPPHHQRLSSQMVQWSLKTDDDNKVVGPLRLDQFFLRRPSIPRAAPIAPGLPLFSTVPFILAFHSCSLQVHAIDDEWQRAGLRHHAWKSATKQPGAHRRTRSYYTVPAWSRP